MNLKKLWKIHQKNKIISLNIIRIYININEFKII